MTPQDHSQAELEHSLKRALALRMREEEEENEGKAVKPKVAGPRC